jgi:LysM repeat protein
MALRRRSGFLAGLLPTLVAGALLGCGGDSPLDLIPTSTTAATAVSSQPTQTVPVAATATAVPTETPGAATGEQEYTVQAGDTLGGIAAQFGVTVDALVQANSITDPNLIIPGETLIIPAP